MPARLCLVPCDYHSGTHLIVYIRKLKRVACPAHSWPHSAPLIRRASVWSKLGPKRRRHECGSGIDKFIRRRKWLRPKGQRHNVRLVVKTSPKAPANVPIYIRNIFSLALRRYLIKRPVISFHLSGKAFRKTSTKKKWQHKTKGARENIIYTYVKQNENFLILNKM